MSLFLSVHPFPYMDRQSFKLYTPNFFFSRSFHTFGQKKSFSWKFNKRIVTQNEHLFSIVHATTIAIFVVPTILSYDLELKNKIVLAKKKRKKNSWCDFGAEWRNLRMTGSHATFEWLGQFRQWLSISIYRWYLPLLWRYQVMVYNAITLSMLVPSFPLHTYYIVIVIWYSYKWIKWELKEQTNTCNAEYLSEFEIKK